MNDQLVLLFPGQSSRYPTMIRKITDACPVAAALLRHSSEILGRDLTHHYQPANPAIFASNRDVQVGVFLANHMHLMMLQEAGVDAAWSLGLSLGEYNHLVHVGALSFEAALRLVDARGRLYDGGDGGMMVSLFPVTAAEVEQIIASLGLAGQVSIGLYNSPRQQVLSGLRPAVERVVAAVEEETFIEATVIEPRLAMHAQAFAPIAERLAEELRRTPLQSPRLPYVANVRGQILDCPTARQIRGCLTLHAYRPVRWQACVEAVAARLAAPCFVEVGPRAVLTNLFGRGWNPGRCCATDAADGWDDHLQSLAAELRHAA